MLPLTEKEIRTSFLNASRKEVTDLTLPAGFAQLDWDSLDYLGWRDPKLAKRAYIVVPLVAPGGSSAHGGVAGVLLRQGDATARKQAQCSWCRDITLPNRVVFYSAKRSGVAGRNGNTVGTLICEGFECSQNVRKAPPIAYLGFDIEAARQANILALQEHAAAFADAVVSGPSGIRA